MVKTKVPCLFDYFDYREYLSDYYRYHKQKNAAYSYRLFAKKAKLGSPNYLKLVVDGKRRITDRTIYQFSRGLNLSADEEKYFRELVLYQEVSDPDSKEVHLNALLKYQEKQRLPTLIDGDKRQILYEWYHPVVRELINCRDFSPSPEWISEKLRKKITPVQAQQSLDLLIRLGLLKRTQQNTLEQVDGLLTSADEAPSQVLRNFHRAYLRKTLSALFSVPLDKREFSSLVLAVPQSRFKELKQEIKEFRKKLNRKYGLSRNEADTVCYVGLFLYPLT